MTARPLGRRAPESWEHVERYPFTAAPPAAVERQLRLPPWWPTHDQGREGSCVGHGVAIERAITNSEEIRAAGHKGVHVRYDPVQLWRAAKAVDEWPATKPADDQGTSVRAAYDVARVAGLVRVRGMELRGGIPVPIQPSLAPDPDEGVTENRWARTVDEIRAAIASGLPVTIGVDWYTGFDEPKKVKREFWLPGPSAVGRVRGGHCVALYAASDRREGFRLVNSWGRDYPRAWLPYPTMELLLGRRGEAALVTDRIRPRV